MVVAHMQFLTLFHSVLNLNYLGTDQKGNLGIVQLPAKIMNDKRNIEVARAERCSK